LSFTSDQLRSIDIVSDRGLKMTNLTALPALPETLSRRDLNQIASMLFASALATQQYADTLDDGDEERHVIADQACAEKALYIRFCESHGLKPAHLDFAGCR
jgi:hypothetical protein